MDFPNAITYHEVNGDDPRNKLVYKKPNQDTIKIGRLEKRIAKLTKQRDFYEARCAHYKAVLDLHPHSEMRYSSYTDRVLEHKHKKELEQRVEEQALLIKKLTS